MLAPITVKMSDEARAFVRALDEETRIRLGVSIRRTQNDEQGNWFKKLTGTDGIWEFRVDGPQNTYRLFAFWDKTGPEPTLIFCTHGLDKKSPKTPEREKAKAERLKREYFAHKSGQP